MQQSPQERLVGLSAALASVRQPVRLSTSIGLAGGPARRTNIEELISVADAALYRAKPHQFFRQRRHKVVDQTSLDEAPATLCDPHLAN